VGRRLRRMNRARLERSLASVTRRPDSDYRASLIPHGEMPNALLCKISTRVMLIKRVEAQPVIWRIALAPQCAIIGGSVPPERS
jgi:hypothetical protein